MGWEEEEEEENLKNYLLHWHCTYDGYDQLKQQQQQQHEEILGTKLKTVKQINQTTNQLTTTTKYSPLTRLIITMVIV